MRVWQFLYLWYLHTLQISTHTPVRVWQITPLIILLCEVFQLTHPWGCDPTTPLSLCISSDFNTHTRVGVTAYFDANFFFYFDFNSHTREGVTAETRKNVLRSSFQLTHPWGCDPSIREQRKAQPISTHTPVRVWRWGLKYEKGRYFISTHTPVRVWLCCICETLAASISTHTPVRVWPGVKKAVGTYKNFNSHTREGVTGSMDY